MLITSSLFYDFQYNFRFLSSTVDLLTVLSDRIDRPGATLSVEFDISKTFYGISGHDFDLISSFLSDQWLWVKVFR